MADGFAFEIFELNPNHDFLKNILMHKKSSSLVITHMTQDQLFISTSSKVKLGGLLGHMYIWKRGSLNI